jgi:hypothetical protein
VFEILNHIYEPQEQTNHLLEIPDYTKGTTGGALKGKFFYTSESMGPKPHAS